jgi:hypothetical protein
MVMDVGGGHARHDSVYARTCKQGEVFDGQVYGGIGMRNIHSQFDFGAQVRTETRSRTIISFLPLALFAALMAALAFIG